MSDMLFSHRDSRWAPQRFCPQRPLSVLPARASLASSGLLAGWLASPKEKSFPCLSLFCFLSLTSLFPTRHEVMVGSIG